MRDNGGGGSWPLARLVDAIPGRLNLFDSAVAAGWMVFPMLVGSVVLGVRR